MVDIADVTNDLMASPEGADRLRHGRDRSAFRAAPGVLHLDYGEDEGVFLVTVQQVPRIRLPLGAPVHVATVDGVGIALVSVALANHVEVRLDALPGPRQAELTGAFEAEHGAWAAAAQPDAMPPPWPAESCTALGIAVADDVGTAYVRAFGQAGGDGTPCETRATFRPQPPDEATSLILTFTAPDAEPATVTLPLQADRRGREE
jgi:hypothetical protein